MKPTLDVQASLIDQHIAKSQLRFLTCGSVDDGKSTLIGRLLYDAGVLTSDQISTLQASSDLKTGTKSKLDFSLLLDGLSAEREQGITIDVAYRFFSTPKRSFVVADCPGHEQYTRNMVTGASNCELAIVLVDATKGLLSQTRRHTLIAAKLGIKSVVLAVNKMDLVGFDQVRFEAIAQDFSDLAHQFGLSDVVAIPVSGLLGENVVHRMANMGWYQGPCLLEHLETTPLFNAQSDAAPLRVVVQGSVLAPQSPTGQTQRAITGFVASGTLKEGASVRVLPSGRVTRIGQILMPERGLSHAQASTAVTFTLSEETDCTRGDIVCAQDDALQMADAFVVDLVWMVEEPLLIGQSFWLKIGAAVVSARVNEIRHQIDVSTGGHTLADDLAMNALGQVVVELNKPIAFDLYTNSKILGGLVLIDRQSNATVAAGMIVQAANLVSENLHWQYSDIGTPARAALKGQTPLVVWLTGLSGAGKSTIANLVEKQLFALGHHTYLLEGDNLRYGLNRDLGFAAVDRSENIRRAGEVARLMHDAGLIVIAAFISPFIADRSQIRAMMPEGSFLEVHIDVSLEEAEQRDPKGLYRKARAGLLKGFTGIDSPYEEAASPEIYIDTQKLSAAAAADVIVSKIRALQIK